MDYIDDKMNPKEVYVRRHLWQWTLIVLYVAFICVCIRLITSHEITTDRPIDLLYLVVGIGASVLMLIDAIRYKITIGRDYIEVRSFTRRRAKFSEISGVYSYRLPYLLILRGRNKNLIIAWGVKDRNLLFSRLSSKLIEYGATDLKGVMRLCEKYPPQPNE